MLKHLHCTAIWALFTLLLPALLSSALHAQTLQVLYTFHGPNGDRPLGQLTLDGAGNIYGTTAEGGTGTCEMGCGTVFGISEGGKLLGSYSFHGEDGAVPEAGLLLDSGGNLFGTTENGGNYNQNCGGASGLGCGVVFKLTPKGKETVYKFTGNGPIFPSGNLVQDAAGNLYGTTIWSGRSGGGTVFKLDQSGKLTVLQGLPSRECTALGLIMFGTDLYGSSTGNNCGFSYIFQMTTDGSYTAIGSGASYPSILTADGAGNLYGDTSNAGLDYGSVFRISPDGNGRWTQTTLYKFCQLPPGCSDGEFPRGTVAIDTAGNIYGTTTEGGTSQNCNGAGCGVVFKLDPNGNETVIHNFTGEADGAFPQGGLIVDSAGNLYGTTPTGGDPYCTPPDPRGCGVVFKITP